MGVNQQIPRQAFQWFLLAQFFLMMPHVLRLPIWVSLAFGVCVFWRWMIFIGRWNAIKRSFKLLLIFSSVAGVFVSYGSFLGLESSVALLVIAFSLKLVEMHSRRDALLLIYLSYFLIVIEFLFDQSLHISALMLLAALLITTSLNALNETLYQHFRWHLIKKNALIFIQALPLMVFLFIVFPRFQPLWQVPLPSHQAKTGLSDTMSPGDISQLSQSSALAFRVKFADTPPVLESLYWRTMALSDFDDRQWSRNFFNAQKKTVHQPIVQLSNQTAYTVFYEATYQPWLVSLAGPQSSDSNVFLTNDDNLAYKNNVFETISYSVISQSESVATVNLSDRELSINTAINRASNPRAVNLADSLIQATLSKREYMAAILAIFRQQDFYYTLTPPLLGKATIDDFLFKSKRGFCSHYASSFVYLMRAAGIPARVVVGYLGGELNPLTGIVLVHQYQAHAWAEVWLLNEGWVRVDPTAFIDARRVESTIASRLINTTNRAMRGARSDHSLSWLNHLSLRWDAIEYYWATWVLQYRDQQQLAFIERFLGELSIARLIFLFVMVLGAVIFWVLFDVFSLHLFNRQKIERRLYQRLLKKLASLGYVLKEGEGLIDFTDRLKTQEVFVDKALKSDFLVATDVYYALCYEPLTLNQRELLLAQLKASVKVCCSGLNKKNKKTK